MRNPQSKKKKIVTVCLLAAAGLILLALIGVILFLPVTYRVDKAWIQTNPDYRVEVTEKDGYTTLIKKNADGTLSEEEFKVMAFTDLHLDTHKDKGDITMKMMIRNIAEEQPDLVVFVGDTVTSAINRRRAVQFCRVMEKLGVYWTGVLGNHEGDNAWSLSRQSMVELFASYPHCLIEADTKYTADGEEVWGCGNHVINLMNADGLYQSLYFLDGGADMSEEDMILYEAEFEDKGHNDYDYVKESQISWYRETVTDIEEKNGSAVPSVLFVHIPLPEFKTAYEEATGETEVCTEALDASVYGTATEDGTSLLFGQRRETICYSGHNSGLFEEILALGSTRAVVSGHDHINDFCVKYKGILLIYNVPGGYSSYNVVSKGISDTLIKGYSVYSFDRDGNLTVSPVRNSDRYPEEQEEILTLYQ